MTCILLWWTMQSSGALHGACRLATTLHLLGVQCWPKLEPEGTPARVAPGHWLRLSTLAASVFLPLPQLTLVSAATSPVPLTRPGPKRSLSDAIQHTFTS